MLHRWIAPSTLGVGLLAGALLAAPAIGQDAGAEGDDAAPKQSFDEVRETLNKEFDALNAEAEELSKRYLSALRARVDELRAGNATLNQLHDAGLFTPEGLAAGLPSDPLARLPWLRRKLETVDQVAVDLQNQFGGRTMSNNHRVALTVMKKIRDGQRTFREEDRDGDGILNYSESLERLGKEGLFEKGATAEYVSNGYVFKILHGDILTYTAEASPEKPGESGVMFYFVDQTGVIRQSDGKTANAQSKPCEDQK